MNSKKETSSSISISHKDIYNFPFQYKLWIAVNSITCEFVKWNIDGTQIEVQLTALDNYLNRSNSIFKVKSRSSFVTHLRGYSFQLTKTEVKEEAISASAFISAYSSQKYSEIVMHFSHRYFLRHRIDLLANIRLADNKTCSSTTGMTEDKKSFLMGNGLEGDPCSRRIGSSSQLSKAHFKHQLLLNFLSETKTLEAKLKASELKSKPKGIEINDEDSMIELSAELFENPHDSVLYMGEEYRSAYAGFYGNCTNEQVLNFFGAYLPKYENDNNEEGEKRIANLNPTEKASPQPNNFQINFSFNEESTVASEDIKEQNVPSSTSLIPPQQNGSLTSSLEPIFIPDEEKDEDILMDEFIKFKEQTENQAVKEFIQEPEIKVEGDPSNKQENDENKNNFKNFFSQYRESLSLLYEKQ